MFESLAEIAFLGFAERATQVRAGGNDGCDYLIQGKWPQPQSSSSVLGSGETQPVLDVRFLRSKPLLTATFKERGRLRIIRLFLDRIGL